MGTRGQLTNMIELGVSVVLGIMYIFGVAFITFGNGSGVGIGNIYFSTWAGFVVSLMLASASFKEFTANKAATQEAQANAAPAPTKADIEGGGEDSEKSEKPEAPTEGVEAKE